MARCASTRHVATTPLGAVEVGADARGQGLEARLVHRRGHVRQMGTLAPVGQRIGLIEEGGAPPAGEMVEEGRHRAREMIRPRRELLDEGRVGLRIGREVPRRVVKDGAAAFLATQRRDVPEHGVHRVALGIVQI